MAARFLPAAIVLATCCLSWTTVQASSPHLRADGFEEDNFLGELVDAVDDLERIAGVQDKFLSNQFPSYPGNDRTPVDGGWSDWLPWWPCTQKCGGETFRFRRCNNPPPSGGGRPCNGSHIERRLCEPCSTRIPDSETVRLRDGPKPSAGRVEVLINGQWGTVCDDHFDVTDAKVVCKQLGYHRETPTVHPTALFGEGTGPIHMDDLNCEGCETSILQCPHLGRRQHNCRHSEDVGIDCDPSKVVPTAAVFPVRLMDGNNESTAERQGRVEVFVRGVWGTVCDDDFDTRDAIVICRALGFRTETPIFHSNAYYGLGLGPIVLDDIRCLGNESNPAQCANSGVGTHDCSHAEDVGVNCGAPEYSVNKSQPYEVRLVNENGDNSTAGRLEVFVMGRWGSVCDDQFSVSDALVVCRALGINTNDARVHPQSFYGEGTGLILLDEVQCQGNESDLSQCASNKPRIHDCLHLEDVGVDCDPSSNTNIRLVDGPRPSVGRLEIRIFGQWGTVCDDFSTVDAQVVCRILGYSGYDAEVYRGAMYRQGSGPVHLARVDCGGLETNLLDCRHISGSEAGCTHSRDVSVSCEVQLVTDLFPTTPQPRTTFGVRLVGGSSPAQGRLEVKINSRWGTVCDDDFDQNSARVVCRSLGFNRSDFPVVRHNAFFGQGQGPIMLDDVACNGNESDLSECGNSGLGKHNCDHSEDVGVECEPSPTTPGILISSVRLVDGGAPNRGRLEVFFNGRWQTVCDECVTESIARVVCRSLNFSSTSPVIRRAAYFGQGSGQIFEDDLFCTGSEARLADCSNFGRGDHNCDHSQDVGLECLEREPRVPFGVRLVNGSSSANGRLEVEINGQWGTVCDDGFDEDDARVVCRSLEINSTDPVVRLNAYFGQGQDPILLDNVACNGNESDLSECGNSGVGKHNCDHSEDVGVECEPSTLFAISSVRLVDGGAPNRGRVEILRYKWWYTICDECFTESMAQVVCRSLNFSSTSPVIRRSAYFGSGSGYIFEDDLFCNGSEASLAECINLGRRDLVCNHTQDVGVECEMPPTPEPRSGFGVRLVGGNSASRGRLEVEIKGEWGTVCDDGFDLKDARVVCRALGFSSGAPEVRPSAFFGSGQGRIWLDNVDCKGNESNLEECGSKGTDEHNCNHSEDVGVDCEPSTTPAPSYRMVRLVNGTSPDNGRVELNIQGEWQTVCEDCFTENMARVVCRAAGFPNSSPVIRRSAYFGKGSGKIFEDDLVCLGFEANLGQCFNAGRGEHDCTHEQDVGVECLIREPRNSFSVRLVGGSSSTQGRLEVFAEDQWGTVCDDGFDVDDARVVCRSLEIESSSSPLVRPRAFFGKGSGNILLDNLNCRGDETSLAECPNTGIGSHNCNHDEDVGVDCNATTIEEVRLVNGSSPSSGRVELNIQGEWQTVCEDCFTENIARAVCQSLNLTSSSPVIRRSAYFGKGSGKIFEDDLVCLGSETNLGQCINAGRAERNCTHDQDVGLECTDQSGRSGFRVRLVDGRRPTQGRVEVFINDKWGTVCDDGFTKESAIVVCRSLGFNRSSSPSVLTQAFFGEGEDPIWLDNVQCSGTENDLSECSHKDIGAHNCEHSEDVGVDCEPPHFPGEVRLVNGSSPSSGRVELNIQGEWQTVCEDCFTENMARVVCRSLNLTSSSPVIRRSAYFGKGSGKIFEDDLVCLGSETNLGQCINAGRAERNCTHDQDVGLECTDQSGRSGFRVRLVDGRRPTQGRVEVFINDKWGTVCDDGFTKESAIVVCRSLGFNRSSSPSVLTQAFFGEGEDPIWLDNVQCSGTENDLSECSHKDIGAHNCEHSEDVGVDCEPPHFPGEVRLVNGSSPSSGRVELNIQGEWQTVCEDCFTENMARVVCRSLNLTSSSPVIRRSAYFGKGSGKIFEDDLVCLGSETNLGQCINAGRAERNCTHDQDVGLECTDQSGRSGFRVRLVDGRRPTQGRVEVFINDKWGTVCDDGFTKESAIVVCRSLGFNRSSSPSVLTQAFFGEGEDPIWLDNVQCSGTENDLSECSHKDIGAHNCEHSEDVGVDCEPPHFPGGSEVQLRLVNGTAASNGRVEVEWDGEWRTVCDECVNDNIAVVICKSMGYLSPKPVIRRGAHYGQGSGQILEDDLFCLGSESSLGHCINAGPGEHDCDHTQDVGIDCQPTESPGGRSDFQVRLVNGSSSSEGRLEVYLNGEWGTVCDDAFDKKDASVVCRSLGFKETSPRVHPKAFFGSGSGPIFLDNVNCSGSEESLEQCRHEGVGIHNCDHSEDVAVQCLSKATPSGWSNITVRLENGPTRAQGRVEVYLNGKWETVCEECFTYSMAQVVCRSLGYESDSVVVRRGAAYGEGSGPIFSNDLVCLGGESNLAECIDAGPGEHHCTHSQDVGVECMPPPTPRSEYDVRLVNGSRPSEGRVEVFVNGTWGTVCDLCVDILDARVVCRSVGFESPGPVIRRSGYFGQGTGPILEDIVCTGRETSLRECERIGTGLHNCSHSQDVGVDCMTGPGGRSSIQVRLMNGWSRADGRVEVYVDGEWQTMCDHRFDPYMARTVCRSLGYNSSFLLIRGFAFYRRGTGRIFEDNLVCTGNETDLGQCINTGPSAVPCGHYDDVGVDCLPQRIP